MKDPLRILEAAGVITGLLFTYLLQEGLEIAWAFALASSGIYLYLCFQKRIYAESLLQVFYIFTAVYGWMHWNETEGIISGSLNWQWHAMIILSGAGMIFITGLLLTRLTDAATPYVDSFTTVFSVFATMLMINLIPENWLYW
ncbi:MAG: nicotinamide riboside transporter PnuC, partial [Owenweeksia sp.]